MIHQLETIVAILGPIGAGSIYILAKVSGPWKRFEYMLDDWHGDKPRPGVTPRPGVMVRLAQLETRGEQTTETIDTLQNRDNEISGSVNQLAIDVNQIKEHLGTIAGETTK